MERATPYAPALLCVAAHDATNAPVRAMNSVAEPTAWMIDSSSVVGAVAISKRDVYSVADVRVAM